MCCDVNHQQHEVHPLQPYSVHAARFLIDSAQLSFCDAKLQCKCCTHNLPAAIAVVSTTNHCVPVPATQPVQDKTYIFDQASETLPLLQPQPCEQLENPTWKTTFEEVHKYAYVSLGLWFNRVPLATGNVWCCAVQCASMPLKQCLGLVWPNQANGIKLNWLHMAFCILNAWCKPWLHCTVDETQYSV